MALRPLMIALVVCGVASPPVTGVFIGGTDLEGERPGYPAFVLRRDGSAAIVRHRAGADSVLAPWTRHEAIVAQAGEGTAKNVLRVVVERGEAVFFVNDRAVARLSGGAPGVDGVVGLRAGAGLSVPVSRLDLTHRLAPPRP